MKTTGMVRRIDDLGRIVIPKEIRKQLMLKEGESVSFAVEHNHIILTKFSMLYKLSPTIQILLERLYSKYHNTFLLCDKRCIVVCSSDGLAKYQRRELSKDFLLQLQKREQQIESDRIAKAEEVLAFLSASLRGEVLEEVVSTESIEGMIKPVILKKQLSAKDRIKAAELLGKRYALFTEKVDLEGNVGVTIIDDIGTLEDA